MNKYFISPVEDYDYVYKDMSQEGLDMIGMHLLIDLDGNKHYYCTSCDVEHKYLDD
jgi:hypothetical protein